MSADLTEMEDEQALGYLINAGLRMARTEGLGLPLFNALRSEHPDVTPQMLGQAVRIIGQGINAATLAREAGPSGELPLDAMPVIPSTFFHTGELGRIATLADVQVSIGDPTDPEADPEMDTWDVRTECGEGITFQELIDCIEAHVMTFGSEGDNYDMHEIVNRFINAYFMGKRF